MTQTITLKGLTCEACTKLITRKFMKIAGVTATEVTLDGQAHVETSRTISTNEYSEVLKGLPYQVVSVG